MNKLKRNREYLGLLNKAIRHMKNNQIYLIKLVTGSGIENFNLKGILKRKEIVKNYIRNEILKDKK